jgi:hypothetical protein
VPVASALVICSVVLHGIDPEKNSFVASVAGAEAKGGRDVEINDGLYRFVDLFRECRKFVDGKKKASRPWKDTVVDTFQNNVRRRSVIVVAFDVGAKKFQQWLNTFIEAKIIPAVSSLCRNRRGSIRLHAITIDFEGILIFRKQ